MKIVDLGRMDKPITLFGGVYSNRQALRALMRAHKNSVAADMICTGDIVAYCADAAGCVADIRAQGCAVVAGNVEQQLAQYQLNCGCGFEEGSTCDLLSVGWFRAADAAIGADDRKWMASLPDIATFTQAGRRFAVIHGGVTDVSRFLWPTSPDADFAEEIAALTAAVGPVDGVIAGHCGMAFVGDVAGVTWINAGVIGMPPNDGAPMTRYAILQDGTASLHSLTYDHEAAHAEMQNAGLTQGYHTALLTGYWPSEDVLPPDLRRAATSLSEA